MDNLDFNEIRRQVVAYIDKEMNNDQQQSFLSQVRNNPEYSREFHREQMIRSKLKENFQRPPVARGLKDRIWDNIRGKH